MTNGQLFCPKCNNPVMGATHIMNLMVMEIGFFIKQKHE